METVPDIPQDLFDEGDASDIRGMTKRIQSTYGPDMQVGFYSDGTNVRVIVTDDKIAVGVRAYELQQAPSPWARLARLRPQTTFDGGVSLMSAFPADIYTEPTDVDPDTLANLGPLRPMAGVWEGVDGIDEHPVAEGTEENRYVERMELQPIDPQTNGPQLFYGLRYHLHVVKPGEVETFHDQVGYWLWEPATRQILYTLAIPRAQIAMAVGTAEPDAHEFEVRAERGLTTFGICSGPFLEHAFRTTEFRLRVTLHSDGRWSYDETTLLVLPGRGQPFQHRDRNTLWKVGEPTPNPLAQQ